MRGQASVQADFVQAHLAHLQAMQNPDGGWGFNANCESRVEPTAWALLGLTEFDPPEGADERILRGLRFLAESQLENGSWAAAPGQQVGCWVTSLACWALLEHPEYKSESLRGLHWLQEDRPRDSGFWFRTMRKLSERKTINAQSAAYSGWSWTPGTASWVEPTCYALIVLQNNSAAQTKIDQRRKVAMTMLLDRMCPGGGWNCGNPKVYGVAGQPQVGPTVWALIALRENSKRIENCQSLDWLENTQDKLESTESLALAHIGLGLYGRSNTASGERLRMLAESKKSPQTVLAAAWTALAFSEPRRWLNIISSSGS
jgi:hypothetical protein